MSEEKQISVNQRFGKLTTIKKLGVEKGHYLWLCICDCGNEKITRGSSLREGGTKSCGCLYKDAAKNRLGAKYGLRKHPLYSVWSVMIDRCHNDKNKGFKNYGGRGITVCNEWRIFINFYNWSIGNGYKQGLSIDRKNNDLGYEPTNCRFTTRFEQSRNHRKTIKLTFNGETLVLFDWSKKLGVPSTTLYDRFHKGLPVDKILNTKKVQL